MEAPLLILIVSILKFEQPVAEEARSLVDPVIVLDNVAHFHEPFVVFVDELLILGVTVYML